MVKLPHPPPTRFDPLIGCPAVSVPYAEWYSDDPSTTYPDVIRPTGFSRVSVQVELILATPGAYMCGPDRCVLLGGAVAVIVE
jgi:hypothetical protein